MYGKIDSNLNVIIETVSGVPVIAPVRAQRFIPGDRSTVIKTPYSF
jgi:hypothetical protein